MFNYKTIYNFILDTLFPKKCFDCGKEGSFICEKCCPHLPVIDESKCQLCHKESQEGLCAKCQKTTALDNLISAFNYEALIIKNLIHAFKYQNIREIIPPLTAYLYPLLQNLQTPIQEFIIIPIPLHKRKLRRRGFNQAEIIAQELSNYFKIPLCLEILKRVKNNPSQAKFASEKDRQINVLGIFTVRRNPTTTILSWSGYDGQTIENKNILLVDDVTTTLATLEEAAKTLKQTGAKKVVGVTLAR